MRDVVTSLSRLHNCSDPSRNPGRAHQAFGELAAVRRRREKHSCRHTLPSRQRQPDLGQRTIRLVEAVDGLNSRCTKKRSCRRRRLRCHSPMVARRRGSRRGVPSYKTGLYNFTLDAALAKGCTHTQVLALKCVGQG